MKSGTWIGVIGVVLAIALALGIVAWQGLHGQLSALEDRVEQFSQQSQAKSQAVSPDRVDQLDQRTEQVAAQLDDVSRRIETLSDRIASLQEQVGGTGSDAPNANASEDSFKFAYVDMFQVLQDLQDSPLVAEPLQQYRERQQEIEQQKEEVRQQFQEGEISASERDQRLSELDAQLQQLNLQLSAPIQQNMIEVIRQIGEDRDYDLVIDNPASQYNAIVLYSQSGQVDDITGQVVEQLTQRLREQQDDTSSESDNGGDDGSQGEASASESDDGTSNGDE